MISCSDFVNRLTALGVDTAIGVPDSTFKGLISFFASANTITHIKASNECEAVAIAAGYYLARNAPALVYMQNSGFGKTVNPCTSLCSREIYAIPSLFMVGWRGRPGEKDEPQHVMMGRILIDLIKTLEMPCSVLDEAVWEQQLSEAYHTTQSQHVPFIMIVPKGFFEPFSPQKKQERHTLLLREAILELIVDTLPHDTLFVSTTGKTSRELFEIRQRKKQNHGRDFLTVGSMGCASSIGFGVALSKPDKNICIIDGDGAALMQLGSMATLGHYHPSNLIHIIIDNNAHESTGGQPTVSETVDFGAIGKACGYACVYYADTRDTIIDALQRIDAGQSLSLLVIKSRTGSRKDLGRPATTPLENKKAFMRSVHEKAS